VYFVAARHYARAANAIRAVPRLEVCRMTKTMLTVTSVLSVRFLD
jgi:hypothetical protein